MQFFLLLDLYTVYWPEVLSWHCEDGIDVLLLEIVLRNVHLVLSFEVLLLQLLMGLSVLEELYHLHQVSKEGP